MNFAQCILFEYFPLTLRGMRGDKIYPPRAPLVTMRITRARTLNHARARVFGLLRRRHGRNVCTNILADIRTNGRPFAEEHIHAHLREHVGRVLQYASAESRGCFMSIILDFVK